MAALQEEASSKYKISVVIVTYNRPRLATSLAPTILKSHPSVEVLIVEQGSEYNKDVPTPVKYFHLSEINISKARNKGWHEASNDIVLFLDDDVEITEHTISAHLAPYEDDKIVGVSGRVINDGELIPTDTNVKTGITDYLATKFIQKFWSTKRQEIDFPYGCNMSFRKDSLKRIGGFDTYFHRIFDDIDIGKRIKKEGTILFVPEALVYHHKAPAGGTRVDKVEKNRLLYSMYGYYIAKHVVFPLSLLTLFIRTITVLKHAVYGITSFYFGFFKSYLGLK